MYSMTFDVTIPVLNEEATLAENVGILRDFLKSNFPSPNQWRIIIADNGSEDQTPTIGKRLDSQWEEVQYLQVPRRGVGLALKTSWSQSQADIVGYMDLDLATDLPHFLEAYRALDEMKMDLVYGSRLHQRSQVIGRSLKREIASRGFNWLLQVYLGTRFSDGMCGFKFLKRDIFPKLHDLGAKNDGWFFSTELLIISEWQKLKLYELPVKWTDDAGSSQVKIIPLAKRYIQSMRAIKRKKEQIKL